MQADKEVFLCPFTNIWLAYIDYITYVYVSVNPKLGMNIFFLNQSRHFSSQSGQFEGAYNENYNNNNNKKRANKPSHAPALLLLRQSPTKCWNLVTGVRSPSFNVEMERCCSTTGYKFYATYIQLYK